MQMQLAAGQQPHMQPRRLVTAEATVACSPSCLLTALIADCMKLTAGWHLRSNRQHLLHGMPPLPSLSQAEKGPPADAR